MSGRPDIIYCLVRRGHAVHYHSNRSVFERWLEKDSWQYPPDECEIIPYVPAYGVLSRSEVEEKDKEIAALREALEMIANRELSFLSECRDIASEALARNAGGKDA